MRLLTRSLAMRLLAAPLLVPLLVPMVSHGATPATLTDRQVALLNNNCVQCHARPNIGVPLMGKADDWKARLPKGEDALLVNVIQGMGGMPPFGYCSACDEADLRALIRRISGLEGGR